MAIPRQTTQTDPVVDSKPEKLSNPKKIADTTKPETTAPVLVAESANPPQSILNVPVPYPAVPIPTVNSAPVPDEDLPSILRRLNPMQRAKLRSAAASEGIIQHSTGTRENPDGSLSVMIRVDGDLVPQLRTWAEEAGKSVDDQVRELVDTLLSSYLLSPWEAAQPVVPAAASPAPVTGS